MMKEGLLLFDAFSLSEIGKAESTLRQKLLEFTERPEMQAQIGEAFYIWYNDPDILDEDIENEVDDITFAKFVDWFIHDYKMLNDSRRPIELFEEHFADDLSQTESVLLSALLDSLYCYFEVEEHPDESKSKATSSVRNIFSGETVTIHHFTEDHAAPPASIIGARLVTLDGIGILSGLISAYPLSFKPIVLDFFNQEFTEYKITHGEKKTAVDFLKDLGYLIRHHLDTLITNPHYITPEGHKLAFYEVEYGLKSYDDAYTMLSDLDTVLELPGGTSELRVFSWIESETKEILSTIELEQKRLTLGCHSSQLAERAKIFFENELKGVIRFKNQRLKHPVSPNTKQTSKTLKKSKLPGGVKSKKKLDSQLDSYYLQWLDAPHSSLEGKTPRGCVNSEHDRKLLFQLLRELQEYYEKSKKRGEPYYDVTKLLKELGLEQA